MRYLLPLILLLTACSDSLHSESKEFDDGIWLYGQPVELGWQHTDTTAMGKLVLSISLNNTYAFQNLWVKLKVQLPKGKVQEQMAEFYFMDAAGKWYVEDSWGTYKFQTVLSDSLRLSEVGEYRFKLSQMMRKDTIRGIESVGLDFVPYNE